MKFKFIHAADLHIDSPFKGLQKYEGAPIEYIKEAGRKAFKNLINLAIDEKVNFIILAGDIFDGDIRDANSRLFFNNEISKLIQKGIWVYLIKGNHDAKSVISREINLPEGVIEFSTDNAETFLIDDLKIAIHGQSFLNRDITENLATNYPEKVDGYFNIGVLHTSLSGSKSHDSYAPCSVDDLISKDYDYWALGHIHKKEIINEKNPTIIYSGNIQGRNIGEVGAKGCYLISYDEKLDFEFKELDLIRWVQLNIDISDLNNGSMLQNKIIENIQNVYKNDDNPFILRVILEGKTNIHHQLIKDYYLIMDDLKNEINRFAYNHIYLEKILIKTTHKQTIDEVLKNPAYKEFFNIINDVNMDSLDIDDDFKKLDNSLKKINIDNSFSGEKEIIKEKIFNILSELGENDEN